MSNNNPSQRTDSAGAAKRTNSFTSLIRRPKSNDILNDRKTSNSRLRKKSIERDRDSEGRPSIQESPPTLPSVSPQPVIQSFGGENYRPRMTSSEIANGMRHAPPVPPVPPVPAGLQGGVGHEPHARSESMTHRSRYSYAHSTTSTLNSPRRVRRRKDPTPYNILIIGARNSGKTSFLNFLKSSLSLKKDKGYTHSPEVESPPPSAKANNNFVHHYQEIEIEKERIGLTLWDSEGLEKGVIDLQLRDITNFVESKFDDTFIEEMKVVRAPGVRDTEIHCVFLILDPLRLDGNLQAAQQANTASARANKSSRIIGALDEDFDLQVLRSLQGKTTVIPIISKADTVTAAHMVHLKRMVWDSLKKAGLDPLEALNVEQEEESDSDRIDEDEEEDDSDRHHDTGSSDVLPEDGGPSAQRLSEPKRRTSHNRQSSNMSMSNSMMDSGYVPMSILSPDQHSLDPRDGPVGRKFPWGFANPYDPEHCDFVKLQDAVFNEWRNEVREVSRLVFYERWRTSRLNRQSVNAPKKPSGAIPFHLKQNRRQ